jgi:hypothetical protein
MMAEWIKTLISAVTGAVVGFVTGMFADILKSRIAARHKREGMRKAMYEELAVIWGMFDGMLDVVDNPTQEQAEMLMRAVVNVSVDAYKQAMGDPALFYSLREAPTLQTLYTSLNIMKQSSVLPNVALLNYQDLKEWRDVISHAAETNVLDRSLFTPANIPAPAKF